MESVFPAFRETPAGEPVLEVRGKNFTRAVQLASLRDPGLSDQR
jgi:hypothetical protein